MYQLIIENEKFIRLGAFIGIFTFVALWEVAAPKRRMIYSRLRRWSANLGIVAINTLILRLLFPMAAVGVAAHANQQGYGLFNQLSFDNWVEVLVSIILLDLAIYLQHVMMHAVPAFWRLHRMHHADPDYDLTTGARFHPIEILLSMLFKFILIAAIGPSVVAVIFFEVILNGMAMFNHGNIKLPLSLDRLVRSVFVTPDMHRVHHSSIVRETNSNFGFNLSIWDRLMGTYRDQPEAGHEGMDIGLKDLRDPRQTVSLIGLLMIPFRQADRHYDIQQR